MILYVWRHPHLAVEEFNKMYLRAHTPVYAVVNGLYLIAILAANPFPLVSYLIYIAVVVFIVIFLPKVSDGINFK
jgi:hypothetical protein